MSRSSAAQRVIELAPGSLRAAFAPATFLPSARTVEVTWTTGARVERGGFYDDPFIEELSLDDGAVDLSRLNNGASVLAAHDSWGLDGVIGVVERAWLQDAVTDAGRTREGRALIRFADTPDVAPILRKVEDGIIRNVSVGYRTHAAEEVERGSRDTPAVIRATSWEPLELSLVPIGADAGAHVRSNAHVWNSTGTGAVRYPCTITTREEVTMPTADELAVPRKRQGKPPGDEPPEDKDKEGKEPDEHDDDVNGDEDRSAGHQRSAGPAAHAGNGNNGSGAVDASTLAERRRAREIGEAVQLAGLDAELGRGLIDEGVTVDTARARIFSRLREQQPTIRAGALQVGADRLTAWRSGMQNFLLNHADPAAHPLTAEGRTFNGLSLLQLGREWLRAHGRNPDGWSRERVAAAALRVKDFDALHDVSTRQGPQAYLVTDDFVSVLLNLARASLTQGYTVAPRTFTSWCRATTLPDFRVMNRIAMGLAPRLEPVAQHAEYKRGALPSRAEIIQLGTFGKIIAFTRQAMVNDDLGALTRIPQMFGNSAATMEGDTVYSILVTNPVMSDGNALFSAAHNNVGTAADITVASMAEARRLLRTQTSPDGQFLNLVPAFLVCGPLKELAALQLTAATVVPTTLGTAIPIALKSVEVVIDARITGLDWYIIASPASIDTIEYAFLEGAQMGGPTLEARDGFDVDGVEFKAREDFAAAPIDWRGMVHNPGA
jgi:phage head maturation protease